MKRITLLLIEVAFTTFSFAQTDFSGTWKINTSKSKLGEQSFAPQKVVITQSGNDMSVETTTDFMGQINTRTSKYKLDGSESSNEGMMGGSPIKSTAKWSDDKKVLTVTTKIDMQGSEMVMSAVYKMDGSNLVIESSMGDFGSETQVFDKQ